MHNAMNTSLDLPTDVVNSQPAVAQNNNNEDKVLQYYYLSKNSFLSHTRRYYSEQKHFRFFFKNIT